MLTYGPVKLACIWFDTNTLLACSLAVVLGLQTCLFGIFTRVFALNSEAPITQLSARDTIQSCLAGTRAPPRNYVLLGGLHAPIQ